MVTVVTGLLPPVALAVLGWVEATDVSFWSALALGVRGWLLAHGAPVEVGPQHVTLVPLGVTALVLLTGSGLASIAARRARAEADLELSQRDRQSLTVRVAGVFTLSYVVCLLVASALADQAHQPGRALLGGLVVSLVASLVGAGRTLDWHPTAWWPAWARAVPRAIGAAVAVQVASGALVAMVALLTHRHEVEALHNSLAPGILGGVVLTLLQLSWLPNLVLWCGSWALGAGFRVGSGTLVSPAWNLTGMMPAIPVLGAIGPNGAGRWWALLWMLSGVIAGAAAAWVVVRAILERSAEPPRWDESSLVGGLSGALGGLSFVVLAALSNGDLGSGRLSEIGARLAPLAVMAPTVMALSGLVVGLVLGLVTRRADSVDPVVVEVPVKGAGDDVDPIDVDDTEVESADEPTRTVSRTDD